MSDKVKFIDNSVANYNLTAFFNPSETPSPPPVTYSNSRVPIRTQSADLTITNPQTNSNNGTKKRPILRHKNRHI